METQARLTFTGERDFEAVDAAEAWCRANGISVGAMQSGAPRGLLRGQFMIAKWRNLTPVERAALHGVMTAPGGWFRHGPITIEMRPPTRAEALSDGLAPQPLATGATP